MICGCIGKKKDSHIKPEEVPLRKPEGGDPQKRTRVQITQQQESLMLAEGMNTIEDIPDDGPRELLVELTGL